MTCLVFLCLFCIYSYGHNNLRIVDVSSAGSGGGGVINSIIFNPACLGLSTRQFVDINYFNKYKLKELSTVSIAYGNPDLLLPLAVHISTFGYNKYRESMFRLALSKVLSSKWIIGVSTQYALLQTELYEEEASKLSTDIGILFISDENLLIGLSITDLPSVRLDDKSINIEDFNYYSIQTGFQWTVFNSMLIIASANYTDRSVFRINMGLEYAAFDNFFIRTGVQTNPIIPAFGAGFDVSSFRFNVAANYYSQLGVCTGVGLSYSF